MKDLTPIDPGLPGEVHHNERLFFQVSSINDMQGTIRAIDTKVSILLAALAIPIAQAVNIFALWRTHGFTFSASNILLAVAILTYAFAVYLAVKTLVGIGNATAHVSGVRLENSFYAAGLYKLSWLDSLFNRRALMSQRSVDEFMASLPAVRGAMLEELAIETMALAYIRDLKLHRQRLAFMATITAVALGGIGLIV